MAAMQHVAVMQFELRLASKLSHKEAQNSDCASCSFCLFVTTGPKTGFV
jgi:hypothetical protein